MKKKFLYFLTFSLLLVSFCVPAFASGPSFSAVSLIESLESADLLLVNKYNEVDELVSSEEIEVYYLDSFPNFNTSSFSFFGNSFSIVDLFFVSSSVTNNPSMIDLFYLDNYLFASAKDSAPVLASFISELYLPPVSVPASQFPVAMDMLSSVNSYFGTDFDGTTPAATVFVFIGLLNYGFDPMLVSYVAPPSDIFSVVTETVDSSIGWISQFVIAITSSPLLLCFVLVTFSSVGITLIKRIKR